MSWGDIATSRRVAEDNVWRSIKTHQFRETMKLPEAARPKPAGEILLDAMDKVTKSRSDWAMADVEAQRRQNRSQSMVRLQSCKRVETLSLEELMGDYYDPNDVGSDDDDDDNNADNYGNDGNYRDSQIEEDYRRYRSTKSSSKSGLHPASGSQDDGRNNGVLPPLPGLRGPHPAAAPATGTASSPHSRSQSRSGTPLCASITGHAGSPVAGATSLEASPTIGRRSSTGQAPIHGAAGLPGIRHGRRRSILVPADGAAPQDGDYNMDAPSSPTSSLASKIGGSAPSSPTAPRGPAPQHKAPSRHFSRASFTGVDGCSQSHAGDSLDSLDAFSDYGGEAALHEYGNRRSATGISVLSDVAHSSPQLSSTEEISGGLGTPCRQRATRRRSVVNFDAVPVIRQYTRLSVMGKDEEDANAAQNRSETPPPVALTSLPSGRSRLGALRHSVPGMPVGSPPQPASPNASNSGTPVATSPVASRHGSTTQPSGTTMMMATSPVSSGLLPRLDVPSLSPSPTPQQTAAGLLGRLKNMFHHHQR